jgi:hypothetical protein
MFEAELVKMKHPKEIKIANPYIDNAKAYVYGKQNVLYPFRLGLGSQLLLFDKAPRDGVEINLTAMLGTSLALLKPVYLDIIKETGSRYIDVVSEKYDENQHFPTNIYGYSGFSKGLGDTKLIAGGYVKTGLSFDWAQKDEKILALEAGIVADLYPKRLPVMAAISGVPNKWNYISFYATLTWGKKY